MKSNKERTVKITYLNEESSLNNFINDFAELIATAIYNKKERRLKHNGRNIYKKRKQI